MDGLAVPAHGFKLLSGTANRPLAEEIGRQLGIPLTKVTCNRFADGEIFVRIDENVRGNDVFIVQPHQRAGGEHHGAAAPDRRRPAGQRGAHHLVMPYYGYSRQDRKDQPRVAIGAKLVANMIVSAGADRVLGIDFHQHQLQGFFDIPVDHLYAMPVLTAHFRKKQLKDMVVVAPDVGSAKMARGFAKRLDASLAIIDKRRPRANVVEVVNVVGEVEGRDCILADDMIDTAGHGDRGGARAQEARRQRRLRLRHARAVLSGPAVERLKEAPIKEVVVTDTIDLPQERRFERAHDPLGRRAAEQGDPVHARGAVVSSLFD